MTSLEAFGKAKAALESCREWIRLDMESADREEFKITMGLRAGGKILLSTIDEALDALRDEMMP